MIRSRWYALLIAGVFSAAGCGRTTTTAEASAAEAKATEAKAAIPVSVANVVVQPSARVVNIVGTLYGNEEVTLSSQVEGQIEVLSADLGDTVQAGQVLAKIDDAQWQARLREAEANLAKARADEARGRLLLETQVISRQEYETMQTRADVAAAQRDTLAVSLRHARVESPISGAIAHRFASIGEYVHPGSQLFSIVAEDPLKLRGDVPERFAHELQAGQEVQVRIDAFPDTVFNGHLSRISPASNRDNRSIAIETLVDNHERKLKPGFFANAAVVTRSDDRALMVPQEALITFAGVTKLFVVRDGVAQEREVQTGTRGGNGLVEITEGIAASEQVAVSGITKLENGAAVAIKEAAAEGAVKQ
ncbi:MAG TPA: efflux RND transporter periplasmic adaptor subunit [Candidatus Acidoferrales bacterium]|nr:efflux RND transporter periplasmic adaptor subunit [Candidatus Acidoferrales bacterium]